MKIAVRCLVFVLGISVLFFAWHKTHNQVLDLQNSGSTNTVNSAEVLVVIGGLIALMAFAPSSETLGRWMSLKRRKRPLAKHYRRRH
ncbi:MAG: hypothetical protein WCC87_14800 [Candidatus Korobacteraceae bacterium]